MSIKNKINNMLKPLFKLYEDLGKELEKIYGKEKAKEIVNKKFSTIFAVCLVVKIK